MKEQTEEKELLGNDFTEGPMFRQLILFAFPLFCSNLLQILYNVADMAIVGQVVGAVGISAVSVGGDIINCMTNILIGFATAGQVLIAQLYGSDNRGKIGSLIGTMTTFLGTLVLIVSIVCIFIRGTLLSLMSTPAEAWTQANNYVLISLFGLFFTYGYNLVGCILRGLGDSRHPFIFICISTVLNIILDFLFVAVFSFGAGGAAAATVLAQMTSFLLSIAFLWKRRENLGFQIHKADFRIDGTLLWQFVRLGLPIALKSSAVQLSKLFVDSFVNAYGAVVSATAGVANRINSISNLFSNAMNAAGSSVISQNIGARKYNRARRALAEMMIVMVPLTILQCLCIVFFPKAIFGLFTSDAQVLELCLTVIPIALINIISTGIRAPMNALINGCGNYKINFTVAILDGLVLRITFSILLGNVFGMGFYGFMLGDAIASYTPCVIGFVLLISRKWETDKYVIASDSQDS